MTDIESTETSPEHFDLIIIGSGSGNSIPEDLSDRSIAIVEHGTFGGTCLNVGCIPSKMFVLPADAAIQAEHSAKLGISTSFEGADWPAIRDRIFGRIDAISASGEEYRASGTENVTLIRGTAQFTGERTFRVEGADGSDVRVISANQILLAAGSRPTAPPILGLEETGYHTSDTIMRLEDLPARVGIIGGGYVAAEMGHVFSGLGSQVTMVNRGEQLLRGQDDEIAARFTEVFAARVDLRLGQVPSKVERREDGIVIHLDGEEILVDELLVATGRVPNTDLLDAEAAGLETSEDGTLVVDEFMRTSVEGVWAIGDVANSLQLKHVANRESATAFWNLAHPHRLRAVDHKAVPAAVFSNPQIASVGLSEEDASAAGYDYVVGKRDYAGTAYGWALVDETSFAKVLVDRATGLILGGHIIGPQAATLIQPLIQAIQFDQTARTAAEAPYWIHPALTEVVENALLEAADQL